MGDSTTFILSNHVIDLNDLFLMNFCKIANLQEKMQKNHCHKFYDFFGKQFANFCRIFKFLTCNVIAQMARFQIEQNFVLGSFLKIKNKIQLIK
jgi:hypothetical protein